MNNTNYNAGHITIFNINGGLYCYSCGMDLRVFLVDGQRQDLLPDLRSDHDRDFWGNHPGGLPVDLSPAGKVFWS